ncbi:Hypothetical protein NTJ_15898 [Nesidiocoris tenuis]|uniref:Uncharacterized protein n=1 Tax=Nesidiocoris tenuis TaxID=355587 RepID=A0ABN7BH34_9HEMI|nr:Hypothetical protein NTJ_15898 [Nesidiocoris tenuis]
MVSSQQPWGTVHKLSSKAQLRSACKEKSSPVNEKGRPENPDQLSQVEHTEENRFMLYHRDDEREILFLMQHFSYASFSSDRRLR